MEIKASPQQISIRRTPGQELIKTSLLLLMFHMTVFVFSPERLPGHGSSANITELLASGSSGVWGPWVVLVGVWVSGGLRMIELLSY